MHLLASIIAAFAINLFHAAPSPYYLDPEAPAGGCWISVLDPVTKYSSGRIHVDGTKSCYVILNDYLGCNDISKPFGIYNETSGYCDSHDGSEPMITPICGGFVWLFGKTHESAPVPPLNWRHRDIAAGDLWFKNSETYVNEQPFKLGKTGCTTYARFAGDKFDRFDQVCGLVESPKKTNSW
ncbi:hypothetical protein EYZ11_003465 [Aspergillus tanneri]|nr:hypothetical protein EYZ11_003465 [Aspergillus tanneri]